MKLEFGLDYLIVLKNTIFLSIFKFFSIHGSLKTSTIPQRHKNSVTSTKNENIFIRKISVFQLEKLSLKTIFL